MSETVTPLIPTDTADFFERAIDELRKQVWVGILLFWLFGLITTRWLRYNAGVQATTATILMQVALYSVIFASLWFRNSRHAPLTQTIFLALTHIMVPVGLFFYGSLQGLGDVALYVTAVISILFGWRRWMYATLGSSLAALLYVYYWEFAGQPLLPFLEYGGQFAIMKMVLFSSFVAFTIYFGNRFYQGLLEKHRLFAEEQVHLTAQLQASEIELHQLTTELRASRQQIVTAQEEERLRLRGNLNNSLGPTLAGLVLRVGAAHELLSHKPEKADTVLADLETGIETVLGDVRSFVYALRPPLLDQLGLSGAVREYVKKLEKSITIELNLPDRIELGAATEVACFNIVQAALEHVVLRTGAHKCVLTLVEEGEMVTLSICENSLGDLSTELPVEIALDLTPDLAVAQEWAEELTGTLTIQSQKPHGTCIQAHLPNTLSINN